MHKFTTLRVKTSGQHSRLRLTGPPDRLLKSDIVKLMALDTGLTVRQCKAVLNSFVDHVSAALCMRETVILRHFGRIFVKDRKVGGL